MGVVQAIAIGELWIITRLSPMPGNPVSALGPGEGKAAPKIVARLAGGVGDQHIGHALALGSWKPGGDKGVRCIDFRVHPQGAPGEEDRHDRHALILETLDQGKVALVAGLVFQTGDVTLEFGIGFFAKDHDGDVRPRAPRPIARQDRRAASAFQSLLYAGKYRAPVGKV